MDNPIASQTASLINRTNYRDLMVTARQKSSDKIRSNRKIVSCRTLSSAFHQTAAKNDLDKTRMQLHILLITGLAKASGTTVKIQYELCSDWCCIPKSQNLDLTTKAKMDWKKKPTHYSIENQSLKLEPSYPSLHQVKARME